MSDVREGDEYMVIRTSGEKATISILRIPEWSSSTKGDGDE